MKNILLTIAICFSIGISFSQDWKKTKPDILYAVDKENNIFNIKVGIGTTAPQFPLEVKGQITSDSMRVKKVLHVGDSSFTFLSAFCPATGTVDEILSNNTSARIAMGYNGPGPAGFSFIKFGVGICSPNYKLHLHEATTFPFQQPIPVFEQFTNSGGTTGGTGSTATDGFLVGVGSNRHAILHQQENLSMDFFTNVTQKMKLNADFTAANQYVINGFNFGAGVNTSGYLLLSPTNTPIQTPPPSNIYDKGAFSLLHLNADAGTFVQEDGYRPWMKTGVTFTSNNDLMYVGHKRVGTANDITDAVIAWSDNTNVNPAVGPDVLKFIFTTGNSAAVNPLNPNSINGMELMRMMVDAGTGPLNDYGKVGIGPLFTNAIRPARRLEVHDGQTGLAQLRLSFSLNANPILGSHTDFRQEANGNMNILPSTSGLIAAPIETFVGINTTAGTPLNTLEIQSGALSPYFASGNGSSGLKFRNLTSNNNTVTNPGLGVLALDNVGNVIYVPGTAGGGLGSCLNPTILSTHADVRLNGNNFYFEDGPAAGPNSVGIGWPCGVLFQAKLDVRNFNKNSGINVGTTFTSTGAVYGLFSVSTGSSSTNFGVWGQATGSSAQENIGVHGVTMGASVQNFGGTFAASGPAGSNNYGILAAASGGTTPYAGLFAGSIKVNSTIYSSDIILKENITTIPNALSTIRQLQPHQFNFKTSEYAYLNLPSGNQFGMVAQEVESILPELVKVVVHPEQKDSEGTVVSPQLTYKGLDYNGLTPITLAAVKELDLAVTVLQNAPAGVSGTGSTNFLTKWQNTNTVGTSNIFETGSGNVGIGTTTPDFQLVTQSNTDTKIKVSTTSNNFFGAGSSFTLENLGSVKKPYMEFQMIGSNTSQETFVRYNYVEFFPTLVKTNILTIKGNGRVGIGTSSPTEALYVVGNIFATGSITQNSDAAFKQNVAGIAGGMNLIKQLKPYSFNFDTTQFGYLNLPGGKQYGLVAQDVETVMQELVTNSYYPEQHDSSGNVTQARIDYKGVNYTALIPILIQAMKEQGSKDSLQQAQIDELSSMIAQCCVLGAKTAPNPENISTQNITLTLPDAPLLGDARPNPNSGKAEIPYYLPVQTTNAKIIFTDMLGRIMDERNLENGYGLLNINTQELPSGNYSYSLVINGNKIDSKTMIKTR